MIRRLRVCALAVALAATPACVSLTPLNPFTTARSVDQQAYALIGAYALALEEASVLVRDPATPRAVKTALATAEARATPAVEVVKIAAVAYRRAETETSGAALARAISEAQRPIADLALLLKK